MEQKKAQAKQEHKAEQQADPGFGKHIKEAVAIANDWYHYKQPDSAPPPSIGNIAGMTYTNSNITAGSQSYMASAVVSKNT